MSSPAELIATPKGGGAFQGIGEKFSPDLCTGTGNFTIPIALPPVETRLSDAVSSCEFLPLANKKHVPNSTCCMVPANLRGARTMPIR